MDLEDLVGLETAVWQALVDGDPAADSRLLAHDFVGVYPTGFSDRDGHVAQIAAGPTVRSFELADARMLAVTDAAVLLLYRAAFERVGHGTLREEMYVSSLWCRRDGHWVNVFSQDTPDTGIATV